MRFGGKNDREEEERKKWSKWWRKKVWKGKNGAKEDGRGKWKEEESTAFFSPLKVTEMPGHLLELHQIKRTHFHKRASTHYMHTTVSPTALSTTDFPACLWWLCYRCTCFSFLVLSLSFDDHTFNKTDSSRLCAPVDDIQLINFRDMTSQDITSEGNWMQCHYRKLSLQKLKLAYTNTAADILDHNIIRLKLHSCV